MKKITNITKGDVLVTDEPNLLNPNQVSFDERKTELEEVDCTQLEKAKKEKQSPYMRWTQYNLENTKEMMWLALTYPKSHAILLFLTDQMDGTNAVICSYRAIQEMLNIGEMTALRAVKVLKENKFLTVLKSGRSNVYLINDQLYWKSWGNNLKYSKFSAKIVLALSEQDESYQRLIDAKITSKRITSVTAVSEDGEEVKLEIVN